MCRQRRRTGRAGVSGAVRLVCGRHLAALSLVGVLGAGAALAQEVPPPVAGQPDLTLPTFGVRLSALNLDVKTVYDTNVAGSDAQVAAARGLVLSDVSVTPSLDARLARPFGRQTLFLTGDFGYTAYARNSVLNRENIAFTSGVTGGVSICNGSLIGNFSRAQADVAYLPLLTASGSLANVKNTFQNSGVQFNVACGRATGFAPTFTVTQGWISNSASYEVGLNAQSTTLNGGLAYRNAVLGTLTAFGDYSVTTYPNRPVPLPSGGIGDLEYRISGGGVSYTRTVGSRLSGLASISYVQSSVNLNVGAYTGLAYSFNLSYQVTPRLIATARFDRNIQPTNQPDASYVLVSVYSAALSYQLGSRISFSLGAARSNDDYKGIIVPLPGEISRDQFENVYGGVSYQMGRHITIGLNASAGRRNVNVPGLGYSDVTTGLTLRASL